MVSEYDKRHDNPEDEEILDEILALDSIRADFRPQAPPLEVQAFIDSATLQRLQGTLIEVLAAMKDHGWGGAKLLLRLLSMMLEDDEEEQ